MARTSMTREEMNAALGMSDEELDAHANEYENDAWDSSHLGKVIMGRPSIANEEVRPITVRLPVSQIAAIDKLAASKDTTRSAEVRAAVSAWVAAS